MPESPSTRLVWHRLEAVDYMLSDLVDALVLLHNVGVIEEDENLGEYMTGQQVENGPYKIMMLKDENCKKESIVTKREGGPIKMRGVEKTRKQSGHLRGSARHHKQAMA